MFRHFFFFFSSTSLLLPTHLPLPSCMCAQACNPMDYSLSGSSVHDLSRQEEWSGLPFPSPLRKSFPLRPFPFGCQLLAYFIIIIYHLIHLLLSTVCPRLSLLSTIYHGDSWHWAHHLLIVPLCLAIILGELKVHVDKTLVTLASQCFNLLISNNLLLCYTLSYTQGYNLWFVTTRDFPPVKFNMPQCVHRFSSDRLLHFPHTISSQLDENLSQLFPLFPSKFGAPSWFVYILYPIDTCCQ